MPTLILVLSLTVDVAQLQMHRLRLRYAVETATLSGASSVDTSYYSQSGRLRLDPPSASTTTRAYLERNLAPFLGTSQATILADAADIRVINDIPNVDPYTGTRLTRPSICARIGVPYRMSLLGFIGPVGSGRLNVTATAAITP